MDPIAVIGTVYAIDEFVMPAGKIMNLGIPIRYLLLVSGTDKDAVQVSFNGGPFQQLLPGVTVVIPNNRKAAIVQLKNISGSSNTIRVAYGEAELRDNRVIIDTANPISADVEIADGDDVTQGSVADAAVTDYTDPATVVAALKGLLAKSAPAAVVSRVAGDSGFQTDSASHVVLAAPGASLRLVVRSLVVQSKGAADTVTISDGTTTLVVAVDGTSTAAAPAVTIPLGSGWPLATNVALTMQATTGTDVQVIAQADIEAV